MGHDLKSIRQEFKDKGIYYTPPELAELLKSYVPFMPRRVYDPTCGAGNLLSVFPDDVEKYGQEINAGQLQLATDSLVNFHGRVGDTLKAPAFLDIKFDCIVANPPFSIEWEPTVDDRFMDAPTIPTKSRADYAFLLHILHYLTDDGVAVSLSFPGVLYRGGREKAIRQWLVESGHVEKVVAIPGDTFVDTKIQTACLVMRKQRDGRDVEFIDTEHERSCTATLEEIRANDFTLSVSAYVVTEDVRSSIDPVALELAARRSMLRKLKADIEMSRFACEMEGMSFYAYLDEIEAIIHDARRIDHTLNATRQPALSMEVAD